ncbi:hypothetical protein IL54_1825 [Sphingobium sp. ba1]|nr:hypothetical protein IL54_1825 [Sphingobium sp. ba1]
MIVNLGATQTGDFQEKHHGYRQSNRSDFQLDDGF